MKLAARIVCIVLCLPIILPASTFFVAMGIVLTILSLARAVWLCAFEGEWDLQWLWDM